MLFVTDVDVDKEFVYRNMGYRDTTKINKRLIPEINKCINEAKAIIKPKVIFDEFSVSVNTDKQKITFDDTHFFTGEYVIKNINNCSSVIIAVSSLGKEFEGKIKECLDDNDTLKGLILDAVGSTALMNFNNKFWLYLVEMVKKRKLGLSRQISPGDNDFPIEQQSVVFELVDCKEIGVVLNESYVMNPLKSLSMIYGVKNDGKISRESHNCRECNLKTCMFRHEEKGEDI